MINVKYSFRKHPGKNLIELCVTELVLGEYYNFLYGKEFIKVRLIKVTRCGYNFLYDDEKRCILTKHLDISSKYKKECESTKNKIFIIPHNLLIRLR